MSEHIIWNEIGTLHFNAGSYAQATEAYQRAIEMGGNSAAMQNLALAYVKKGELAKALPIYQQALDLTDQDKDKSLIWEQLGKIYTQLQDEENALQAYQMAAKIAPESNILYEGGYALVQDVRPGKNTDTLHPDPSLSGRSIVDSETSVDEKAVTELTGMLEAEEMPAHVDSATPSVASTDLHSMEGCLFQINIEQIHANPAQPRLHVDAQDLVESIREYGIIQPLIVTPSSQPDRYNLVSGERRLEAARQVGLDTVPAIVRDLDELQCLELALIENVQRKNLSLLEQADAYAQLKSEFGLSPNQIARRMGKSSVAITNLLHLLELPEKIRRALDAGRIDEEHARALFLLTDKKVQEELLVRILNEDLSVRKTEVLVRGALAKVIEENNQKEPELDDSVLVIIPESQALEVTETIAIEDVEEVDGAEELHSDRLTENSSAEENSNTEPVKEFVVEQDSIVAEESIETEATPAEENVPENVDEDIQEGDGDTVPYMSLPQTATFDDPQQHLSDEQVRNRIITYKRVTEVNPNNDKAWGQLGNHYAYLGDDENSINAYFRAIDLAPAVEIYHYQLGQVYVSQRRFEDAVAVLEKVVEINDENVFAHCALASCYRHLDLDEKVQEHLDIVAPVIEYEKPYNQACFEAINSNVIRSVELLRASLRQEQTTIEQIQRDPDFDFIREEPIFDEFIRETVSLD